MDYVWAILLASAPYDRFFPLRVYLLSLVNSILFSSLQNIDEKGFRVCMKELHLKSVYDPVSINWITMPGNQVLFLMVTSAPLSNVTQLRFSIQNIVLE